LLKTNELLGLQLLTLHNIFFMNDLMNIIREAIEKDRVEEAEKEWYYSK
jgi:queuine tRNA-ribosyltransferase